MRARNIKPAFYKNADLAECSIAARLLAPALWMMADREGRLNDRPKQIKGECFPYDNLDIDNLLSELQRWGHIIRYEVDGAKYIQICNFEKHQRPHPNEIPSIIPKVESTSNQGIKHFALNADTPLPSSLTPDLLTSDFAGAKKLPPMPTQKKESPEFETLWNNWRPFEMVKGNRMKAHEKFIEALKHTSAQNIQAQAKAYCDQCERFKSKTQHVATWLHQRGWETTYAQPERPKDGFARAWS